MKRFWCSCPYDDTEIKEAIDGYWVSFDEADAEIANWKRLHDADELCINNQHAELKRRDDEIAELRLRIDVAMEIYRFSTLDDEHIIDEISHALSIPGIHLWLEDHPEYVPSGNEEQS